MEIEVERDRLMPPAGPGPGDRLLLLTKGVPIEATAAVPFIHLPHFPAIIP